MARRIVHIVQKMAPGGLEVLVLELAQRLEGRHYIVSLEGDVRTLAANWPRLASAPAEIFAMDKKSGIDLHLAARLSQTLADIEAEAVVTHHAGPLLYGGIASLYASVKAIIHVEHDVWHLNSLRRRMLMKYSAKAVRPHVVGVSEKMRSPLQQTYSGLPVNIIANGVDVPAQARSREEARRRLGIDIAGPIVGAAGRLETVKGHDLLLSAFASLAARATLLLAGDGSQRQALQDLAKSLGIADRVRFLGHRDDIDKIYPAFDVFCQPSRNEGLPLAILEAQAQGVPVVATDVGDIRSAICPQTGAIVQAGDIAAMTLALEQILFRKRETASPRNFIASHFDIRHTIEKYNTLIERGCHAA